MDEWTPCGDKMQLYLFVRVCIINTLFEATFSKSIGIHQGIIEQ